MGAGESKMLSYPEEGSKFTYMYNLFVFIKLKKLCGYISFLKKHILESDISFTRFHNTIFR